MIKRFLVVSLVTAVACMAQLMPAKKADSIAIDKNALKYNSTTVSPLVNSPSRSTKGSAMDNATDAMKQESFSNDSTTGTLIGIGAEFVGGLIKDRISPDSYETQRANFELKRERQWSDAQNQKIDE